MQNQGTARRFKGLASRLKRREAPPPPPPQGNQSQTSQAANNDYNDRQLVQARYKEAADRLKEAVEVRKGSWGSFDFEELSGEPEGFDDSQFKNKMNTVLMSREMSIKDRKGWSKFTYTVECVFTAFSPFAKKFLTVAKDAQSVMPLSPFDFYS